MDFDTSSVKKIFDDALDNPREIFRTSRPRDVEDFKSERERIKNRDLEQDTNLKNRTLRFLIRLISGETVIVYLLAVFQGLKLWGFWLDEWNFRLIIAATLTQSYLMLRIAMDYLFPKK